MPPISQSKDATQNISLAATENPLGMEGRIPGAPMERSGHAFESLVFQCRLSPSRTRLSFLRDDDQTAEAVDGEQLVCRAEWLAKQLIEASQPGDRVLLAFPAGIDFVVAFLASVRAGLIPVPVPYPKPRRPFSRYQSVAMDCGAKLGLTNLETLRRADVNGVSSNGSVDETQNESSVQWLSPSPWSKEAGPVEAGVFDRPDPDVLFLQYTSGSTGTPKGVRVTLANLLANLKVIGRGFGLDQLEMDRRVVCSWLPAYHDMGLVGIILSTLIHDGHAVLLSPTSFMQRPGRWLSAVSDYRAAITVAPCFGYRYAAAKVSEEELGDLDLSNLKVAACGAEPVDPAVLETFAERFETAGFRRHAFYPCYGLAESTLMVTGADRGQLDQRSPELPGYDCKHVSRQGLRESFSRAPIDDLDTIRLVSSGVAGQATTLRIVNAATCKELEENEVGEIWVHSPSVADGYWKQTEISEEVFHGRLDNDSKLYLRTGDLGFLSNGDLYVTGRMKDLIIIRGQNHYPEDLERTILASGDDLTDCLGAAFSVPGESGESLVIVHELPRGFAADQTGPLLDAIRIAIASEHDLIAKTIVLIRFASMPRTSSGKVQRSQCRQSFLDDSLKVIDQWKPTTQLDPTLFPDLTPLIQSPNARGMVRERIERVLLAWLVRQVGAEKNSIDAQRPFAECGIDSLMAVEMSGQLEQWLDVRLSPVIAWSHPNAEKLSEYLTDQVLGSDKTQESVSEPSIEMLLAEIESMNDSDVNNELDGLS